MLRGVRSRLTYASLVTCSMRPPSQAFQLRVIVSAIASAISTTSTGVPNRRQAAFSGLIVCSICGCGASTIGVVAISTSSVQCRPQENGTGFLAAPTPFLILARRTRAFSHGRTQVDQR